MPAAGVGVHRALAEDSRIRILQALQASREPLDARALGESVGLHFTTVRGHLDVLIDAGLVASSPEQRGTRGRPRILYEATAEGVDALRTQAEYRFLAQVLAGHVVATSSDPAEAAASAGRPWGAYLVDRPPPHAPPTEAQARARVHDLMERLGFQPEAEQGGEALALRRCPFLDVALQHREVACSVHLGLLQGALDAMDAPLAVASLEPFVTPSRCVATFRRAVSGERAGS